MQSFIFWVTPEKNMTFTKDSILFINKKLQSFKRRVVLSNSPDQSFFYLRFPLKILQHKIVWQLLK